MRAATKRVRLRGSGFFKAAICFDMTRDEQQPESTLPQAG